MASDDISPTPTDESDGTTETFLSPMSSLDLTLRPTGRDSAIGRPEIGAPELIQIRPIEWESLTSVGQDEDDKEYQSDGEMQSIINELASQIAAPATETDREATPRRAGPAARSYGGAGVVQAPPEVEEPVDLGELTVLDPAALALAPTPVVDRVPEPEPVIEAVTPVEPAPIAPTLPPVTPAAVPAATVAVAPPIDAPSAEPVTGPVAVPPITEATPVPVAPAPQVPAAASPLLLPKIEPKPGAGRPTKPVDFHSLLGAGGSSPQPPVRRRRRRNPLAGLFKLLVVVGLLGGAAYLGKIYYLDQQWPDGIEPIAEDVAEQRGLEWQEAVDVVTLGSGEYALRLAQSMLDVTAADTATLSVEWRAMGLAEGSLDLAAIGSAAIADQPAFYDPIDGKIYEIEGMSDDLREIVLTRALGNALLDQHFDWGTAVETATGESVKLGVRSLYDGDALALTGDVVATLLADPARAAAVTEELAAIRADAVSLSRGASPYAIAIVGRAGDPSRHLFSRQMMPTALSRTAAEEITVMSDASVYDGVRGRTSEPAEITLGPATVLVPGEIDPGVTTPGVTTPGEVGTTEVGAGESRMVGMIYWYYVLAGRIDSTDAWNAALAWNGDLTEQALLPDGRCVSSTIATIDANGQQRLLGALQQWAAAAPVEAMTTVSAGADLTISVRSCDPGPSADTVFSEGILPFGHAESELVIAGDLLGAGLPRSEAARVCVISAVRAFGTPALVEPASIDPALTEPELDLTSQAARDLMAGCAGA